MINIRKQVSNGMYWNVHFYADEHKVAGSKVVNHIIVRFLRSKGYPFIQVLNSNTLKLNKHPFLEDDQLQDIAMIAFGLRCGIHTLLENMDNPPVGVSDQRLDLTKAISNNKYAIKNEKLIQVNGFLYDAMIDYSNEIGRPAKIALELVLNDFFKECGQDYLDRCRASDGEQIITRRMSSKAVNSCTQYAEDRDINLDKLINNFSKYYGSLGHYPQGRRNSFSNNGAERVAYKFLKDFEYDRYMADSEGDLNNKYREFLAKNKYVSLLDLPEGKSIYILNKIIRRNKLSVYTPSATWKRFVLDELEIQKGLSVSKEYLLSRVCGYFENHDPSEEIKEIPSKIINYLAINGVHKVGDEFIGVGLIEHEADWSIEKW